MTIREFQENYRKGIFNTSDVNVQIRAGWKDWFCRDSSLQNRLKGIANVINGITDPYILDNYEATLLNCSPIVGPSYDRILFKPISVDEVKDMERFEQLAFNVTIGDKRESHRYVVDTPRNGYLAETSSDNVKEIHEFINNWSNTVDIIKKDDPLTVDKETLEKAIGKVGYITIDNNADSRVDQMEGYAEVLSVKEDHVQIQWVGDVIGYGKSRVYPSDIYTQPSEYPIEKIGACSDMKKMSDKKIEKYRNRALADDKDIFKRYEEEAEKEFAAGIASISIEENGLEQ